jgi:hypothetical protein
MPTVKSALLAAIIALGKLSSKALIAGQKKGSQGVWLPQKKEPLTAALFFHNTVSS